MSVWSRIKGLFSDRQDSPKTVTPALKPAKARKRRRTGLFMLMFLLVFIALVVVSEAALAIINFFF